MEAETLESLIEEIRDGRTEDTTLEWKRAWWAFGVEKGQREFLKDISAMANATAEGPRRILVGVARDGTKHDAALPCDEAELQQRLHAIDPWPSVTFTPVKLDVTITVISIEPPYDPPYVTKYAKEHSVHVRAGSSSLTPSRAHFDRWYAAKTVEEREQAAMDRSNALVAQVHRHLYALHSLARVHDAAPGENYRHYSQPWRQFRPALGRLGVEFDQQLALAPDVVRERWGWLPRATQMLVPGLVHNLMFNEVAPPIAALMVEIEKRLPTVTGRVSMPESLAGLVADAEAEATTVMESEFGVGRPDDRKEKQD